MIRGPGHHNFGPLGQPPPTDQPSCRAPFLQLIDIVYLHLRRIARRGILERKSLRGSALGPLRETSHAASRQQEPPLPPGLERALVDSWSSSQQVSRHAASSSDIFRLGLDTDTPPSGQTMRRDVHAAPLQDGSPCPCGSAVLSDSAEWQIADGVGSEMLPTNVIASSVGTYLVVLWQPGRGSTPCTPSSPANIGTLELHATKAGDDETQDSNLQAGSRVSSLKPGPRDGPPRCSIETRLRF